MTNFTIVNPFIEGSFDNNFSAKNPEEGAQKAWLGLSKYIVKSLPKFRFSLQDSNKKLHHFEVTEEENGKTSSFEIKNLKVNKNAEKQFLKRLDTVKEQSGGAIGGKHRKDKDDDSSSSSSSDSEDDLYERVRLFKKSKYDYQPVNYWWYSPLVYTVDNNNSTTKTVLTYNNVFLPQFTWGLTPYVEVDIINYGSAFLA
jgi:hypothetical protein